MPRAWRGGLGIALAFLTFQTAQSVLLKKAFAQEEQWLADRLRLGLSGLLNQANHDQDDLYVGRALQILEAVPGILRAQIESGHFRVVVSSHASRSLARRTWWQGTALGAVIWLCLFGYLRHVDQQAVTWRKQSNELEALLEMERHRRDESDKREQAAVAQTAKLLDAALAEIERPVLLLDHRQRVLAMNRAAEDYLEPGTRDSLAGKSWQEVPTISQQGQALEESLNAPYRGVRASSNEFLTIGARDGEILGTWVTLGCKDQTFC